MESLPKYTEKNKQERIGVNKIALMISELGYIFRENPNSDVGIDGVIELVNNSDEATGKLIAVQIKSGDSFLYESKEDINNWTFYPEEKHKHYWEKYLIPIFILIYRPADGYIYFLDVRYYLKANGFCNFKIPKTNILNESNKLKLFENIGYSDELLLDTQEIFSLMISSCMDSPSFNLSYLDLFVIGLTNNCRHIYFDVSVAMDIAECRSQFVSIGGKEYDFLYSYFEFILKQNLTEINFEDCLIDWKENNLVPRFIAPLTRRGRELLNYIQKIETNNPSLMPETKLVQERLIQLVFDDYYTPNRIEKLQKIIALC